MSSAPAGCERGDNPAAEEEEAAVELEEDEGSAALPAAAFEAPPLPQTPAYTLEAGGTISQIARERYGSGHYARMIMLHNRIKDPARLPVGKTIKTPPLIDIYHDAGVMTVVGDEVRALLKAHAQLRALEGPLTGAYEGSAAWEEVEVPAPVKAAVADLRATLDAAVEGYGRERPEVEVPPHKLMEQLREASKILENMAGGTSGTPDIDGVHQRIGNAMSYTILWAQHGYK